MPQEREGPSRQKGQDQVEGLQPSSGVFSPSSISNLVHWYRVRSLQGFSNGDPVGTLPDLVGSNNYTAAGVARPLYRLNAGDSYLEFDTTDDAMGVTFTGGPTGFTSVDVFSLPVSVVGYRPIFFNGAIGININGSTAYLVEDFASGGGTIMAHTAIPSYPTDRVHLLERVGSTARARNNGVQQTNGAVGGAVGVLTSGALSGAAGAFENLNFKEQLIFNGALSAGDQTQLATYILAQYGLTL